MRILHVIPGLTRERGGPTTVVQALTRHQVLAGHQVAVLTTDQGQRHGEHFADLHPGVWIEKVAVRGPDRLAYAPRFTPAVRTLGRWGEVIHVHSLFTYPVHQALRMADQVGVPVILRPCGLLHPFSLRRSRWVKQLYLALWGSFLRRICSAWHYTSLQEATQSWPGPKATHFVLPNGIEPDDFATDRSEARRRVQTIHPALGDSPFVLFLGRLHPKKRLDLLLKAFLQGAPDPFRLVVAGPDETGLWGPLMRSLRVDDPRRSRIVRVGPVSGMDKHTLLAAATLFALPSEHENFGNAALEALAAGTPVLLSPQVDLAEVAQPCGAVFTAPLAPDLWADRMRELLAAFDRLAAAAEAARAWVRQRYAWSRLTEQLTQHYHALVSAFPSDHLSLLPSAHEPW